MPIVRERRPFESRIKRAPEKGADFGGDTHRQLRPSYFDPISRKFPKLHTQLQKAWKVSKDTLSDLEKPKKETESCGQYKHRIEQLRPIVAKQQRFFSKGRPLEWLIERVELLSKYGTTADETRRVQEIKQFLETLLVAEKKHDKREIDPS